MNIKGFLQLHTYLFIALFLLLLNFSFMQAMQIITTEPTLSSSSSKQNLSRKQMVFDLFKVLIWVDKEKSDEEMQRVTPTESPKFNSEIIMSSPLWPLLDAGEATAEDIARSLDGIQDYNSTVTFIENIGKWINPIHVGMEIYKRIKAQWDKYDIYLLSNISKYCLSGEHDIRSKDFVNKCIEAGFPNIFEDDEKDIFSYRIHMLKPQHNIYQYLLDKFHPSDITIKDFAQATIFNDDSKPNLESARDLNITPASCQCHSVWYFTLVKLGIIEPDEQIEQILKQEEPKRFEYFHQFNIEQLQDLDLIARELKKLPPERCK